MDTKSALKQIQRLANEANISTGCIKKKETGL